MSKRTTPEILDLIYSCLKNNPLKKYTLTSLSAESHVNKTTTKGLWDTVKKFNGISSDWVDNPLTNVKKKHEIMWYDPKNN